MKRADKRSPRDIAILRLTNLMDLPDRDLCLKDHKTSAAPAPYRRCGHNEITATGVWVCPDPGEWFTYQQGHGAFRACTARTARAIRARLWLQRRHLQLDLNGDTS